MNAKLVLTTAVVAGLTGCMVGPNYRSPQVRVPEQFTAATQPAGTQPATTEPASTQPVVEVDLRRWWETFDDPKLNELIARAIDANLDVRLAEARVREARAQLQFNQAVLFPTVDSSAAYSRNRPSKNAFSVGSLPRGTTSGGTGGTGTGGTGTGGTGTGGTGTGGTGTGGTGATSFFSTGTTNLYRAGFDAGWEVDIFGGTRRAIQAARFTLESQVEARRNALVTLLSEVAQNYILLRGFQYELQIVQNNVAAQRDTLNLQRSKFQAGIATDLDVAQSEALLATTEAQMPSLQTQIEQSIHRLGVLLNVGPEALERELSQPAPLPVGPARIPPGLPSDLVRRRPDVQQAERNLGAATANIGVAVAELFPKFNITGSLGLESLALKSFANSSSVFWSIGPQLTWRLFDAGQIWANVHIQDARQQESLIQYQQIVQQSLSDVEDALVAYNQEQARRLSLQHAVEANRRAVSLALQLNSAGVVDFLNVLTSQQALYSSEDQLAISDRAVSTDLVALYKALGGGWELTDQPAAESSDAHINAWARETGSNQ